MIVNMEHRVFKLEVRSLRMKSIMCDRIKVNNLCFQALKYSSKSHPGGDHRHEKVRESSDFTPPSKMLKRSDSPENKHSDSVGHGRTKAVHTHRVRDRDGGKGQ